jgi:methionine-gamma-lyase
VTREGVLLARVSHANVVTVYGAERHDGRVGLWMELVRGHTLEELLGRDGPLAERETVLVGLGLCRALAAVHAAGIIHRDVKSTNVMREEGGRIVLMDFGASVDPGKDGTVPLSGMSNPTLTIPDLPRLGEITRRHGVKLVVDNTFSPLLVTPARLGADVVVHSVTKFVNGASDVIAGAICGSHEFLEELMNVDHGGLMLLGPTMDPTVAFHISLRLPHLAIRMKEHGRRARIFAERLRERGYDVIYPGLPSHPQHELLKRMANPGYGSGGVLAVDLHDAGRATAMLEILQNKDHFGFIAVSLGYFESLVSCSASSTSSELSDEEQHEAGISPGLLRISVGYTGSVEQRWSQLDDALRTLEASRNAVTTG